MKAIQDKILKSEYVDWKRFEFIQSENFKELKKPAYEKLKQSIIKNSFVESFKVWQNGKQLYCLDGYHRCLVLKELEADGYDVPEKFRADFIDCKDKKEAAKLVTIYSSIYANITDEGLYEFLNVEGLNFEELKLEMDIPDLDLGKFEAGYIIDEVVEDEPPEPPKNAQSKPGDLYELPAKCGGFHRVLCGDSTKREDVERLMDGNRADLGLTDPPYNLGYKYNTYVDKKQRDEYKQFCGDFYNNLKLFTVRQVVTCGKKNIFLWGEIQEPVDYAIWYANNKMTGGKVSNLALCEPILFYGEINRNARPNDFFSYSVRQQEDVGGHTCPKELKFWTDLVKSYSVQSVLDLFAGSGSTLIAAEQTNRVSYSLEIDPLYVDVTVQRYVNFTGNSKIKKNGSELIWNAS